MTVFFPPPFEPPLGLVTIYISALQLVAVSLFQLGISEDETLIWKL